MRLGHYVLDGHDVVEVDDVMVWARWFEKANRVVARDTVGDVIVSTVFIGLDHNFGEHGPPLVFETMLFAGAGGKPVNYRDLDCERYSTWDEAVNGHRVFVEMVKLAQKEAERK